MANLKTCSKTRRDQSRFCGKRIPYLFPFRVLYWITIYLESGNVWFAKGPRLSASHPLGPIRPRTSLLMCVEGHFFENSQSSFTSLFLSTSGGIYRIFVFCARASSETFWLNLFSVRRQKYSKLGAELEVIFYVRGKQKLLLHSFTYFSIKNGLTLRRYFMYFTS